MHVCMDGDVTVWCICGTCVPWDVIQCRRGEVCCCCRVGCENFRCGIRGQNLKVRKVHVSQIVSCFAALQALHKLGKKNVPVYDGSWTEWADTVDAPVETTVA